MLREKRKKYRKEGLADTVAEISYLEQLVERVTSGEGHLQTLADFLDFCEYVRSRIV